MRLEKAMDYIMKKPGAQKTLPFDHETLVFKVGGKMFALVSVHEPDRVSLNLKCIPEVADELRRRYEEIIPGYHMNKRHWNTVYLDGELEEAKIFELIDISYELVFDKLTKKAREEILGRRP